MWVLGSEFLHPNIINILTNIYTIFYVAVSGHGKPVRYSETGEFKQMFILVTDISFLEDFFVCVVMALGRRYPMVFICCQLYTRLIVF